MNAITQRSGERGPSHADVSARSSVWFVWRGILADRWGMAGAIIVILFIACALLAPLLAPYDPTVASPSLRLKGIGTPGHWLGLDTQGRDVVSRLIYGTRSSLIAGFGPVLIGSIVAVPLGMLAGYFSRVGQVIMRIMDVFFAFPMVLLAILLTTFIGPGLINLIVALTVVLVPYNTRIVYVEAQRQRDRDYIEAARASGSTSATILFSEMLPHIIAASVVYSITVLGPIIVIASGLSFLGLGVQPPTPEWGLMVSEGRVVLHRAAHLSTLPGLVIVVLVTGINLLGDSLRDSLDPKTRLMRVQSK